MTGGWTLGIESTKYTFSFGLVDADGKPRPSASDTIRPTEGGIHPREAPITMLNIQLNYFPKF